MPSQTLAQRVRAMYPGAYDDLSDAQLESAVRAKFPGVYDDLPSTPETPEPAVAPMASHTRPRQPVAGRGSQIDLSKSYDFAGGVRAGAAETVFKGADLLVRRPLGLERIVDEPDVQAMMTPPESAAGRVGYMAERAAELALPLRRVASSMRGLPFASRLAAEGATGAGVAAVQSGGDPQATIEGGLLGATLPAAAIVGGQALRATQRAAAGAKEGGLGGAVAGALRTVAPVEARVMIKQAIKPRATNTRWDANIDRALPEVKASEAVLGKPIESVDELLEATTIAKKRVRAQYDEMAGPRREMGSTVDLSPVAVAMERSIPKKLQLERPDVALRLRESADVYRQRFSLEDAEQLLKETNADLESFYNKYPPSQRRALAADPEAARLNAQAKALRDVIYDTLDAEGGGTAARELQRRYGALLDLELETYRRANVAARQQPESLSEQLSAARAASDMARGAWRLLHGDVTGAADIASGVAMRDTAKFLKEQQTANNLIKRALAGYRRRPEPVPMPSHRPVRGLLPRGPIVTPPPADASFVRGVPAEYARREIRGLLPPAVTRLPPVPSHSGGWHVTPKSIVQRDPRTGRMKRVYLSEGQ